MIQEPEVKTRSVFEVWPNSLWSTAIFQAFIRVTRSILELSVNGTSQSLTKLDNKVKLIIKYWDKKKEILGSYGVST